MILTNIEQKSIEDLVGQKYQQFNLDYRNKIEALIDEKKHASLAIALALADNYKIKKALIQNNHELIDLGEVSSTYKKNTDFKNVWIQIQDSEGKSFKRSWTQKRGDDLSKVRYDVKEMVAKPTVKSTVSIGKFDMTFKSMVPIYSDEKKFIGIFEIITHFNSIAKKIQEDGSQLVIAVDKKYKKQLKFPFTKLFVGDYYIANLGADVDLIDRLKKNGIENYLNISGYKVANDTKMIFFNYKLFDEGGRLMATFIIAKKRSDVSFERVDTIKMQTKLYMFIAIVFLSLALYFVLQKDMAIQGDAKKKTKKSLCIVAIFICIALCVGILCDRQSATK
jgi:hypothetical protein